MATQPDRKLLEDKSLPRVKLDGVEWAIPKMGLAELKVIGPIMSAGAGAARRAMAVDDRSKAATEFFGAYLEDIGTVVFLGLKRGHPDLTRDEFDAMGTDLIQLTEAYQVVTRQAGGLQPKETNGVGPAPFAPAPSPTTSA